MDVSFLFPGSGVDISSDNNIADAVLSDSEFSSLLRVMKKSPMTVMRIIWYVLMCRMVYHFKMDSENGL